MNDQHTPSIHDSVTAEDWGAYSVIAVSFEDDNNAYAAMTQLKELDSQGRMRLDEATVVVRGEDGELIEKDQVDSNFPTITVGAGLIGDRQAGAASGSCATRGLRPARLP
jgi:uncharacterized membrane protein